MRASAGSSSRAMRSSVSSPWPIETPGASELWMVIERRRSKRLSFCGAAVSRSDTKEAIGMRSPFDARMNTFDKSFGAARAVDLDAQVGLVLLVVGVEIDEEDGRDRLGYGKAVPVAQGRVVGAAE